MSTLDPNKRLYYLHELSDYKVHHDDYDVRGWELIDGAGRRVGRIDNLLVDLKAQRVRYLDVEVDDSLVIDRKAVYQNPVDGLHSKLNEDGDVHVIVPIGMAVLDAKDKDVKVSTLAADIFQKVPKHAKGSHLTPEYEYNTVNTLTNNSLTGNSITAEHNRSTLYDTGFYDHSHFDDTKLLGKQQSNLI